MEQKVRALYERGRKAWPSIAVSFEAFAARVGASPAVDGLHAEDLYLALGCELGLPAALKAFDAEHLAQVASYLDTPKKRALADEVRQQLRVRLLVSPKAIGSYTGRGALGGFVRIATVRMARDLTRGKKEQEGGEVPDVAMTAADPELQYLRKRHAADFKTAFQRVLAALPDEDRNILSLHLFDELTTEAIGALYRVDGSTIRRRIQKMRQTIFEETRRALVERLALKTGELDSLLNLVRSELDLSIRKYLKKAPSPP